MLQKEPLVTVCIPSFNHARFVAESILSVASQEYTNLELLIIDDGSSDNSVAIISNTISKIENRFVRLEFIARENVGLSKTLNQALTLSSGKYFSMLSSDDVLLPQKTKTLVSLLENNSQAGGAFAGYKQINEDGLITRCLIPKAGTWNFKDVLDKKCQLYAPTMLLRTSAVKDVGGYWEDISLEDRAMALKLANAGFPLLTIDKIVAKYRWHPTNTVKNTDAMTSARLAILNKFENTADTSKARAKVYFGAALESAKLNKKKAKNYFKLGVQAHPPSILSKPAFRAARRIFI